MKKLLLVAALTSMVGCSSSIDYKPETKVNNYNTPEENLVSTAYVGDYMLDKGKQTTNKFLTVEELSDGSHYDIYAGSYKKYGQDKMTSYYSIHNGINGGAVIQGFLADPPKFLSMNEDNDVCVSTVYMLEATCYTVRAKEEYLVIESDSDFKQTLIYNGSVGDKLNISYREFQGGIARGAFTNNVEYDMSRSRLIRYKGAEIEVIDYDNSSIKFKVKKHFR
ncbi:MAG: hypothetical protein QNK26_18460 [Moritella sp.]|uniref:hypothetical protein n=1 Tax=Moritella sp. TaxID=78556 RepID=UPI0029B0EEDB|nr:hypothetical protein [Moritella sp.]MDX2322571.1 hypothetical protein [Moritella sp.]